MGHSKPEYCPKCGNVTAGVFQPSDVRKLLTSAAKKGGMKAVLGLAAGIGFPVGGNIGGFIAGAAIDFIYGDDINKFVDKVADWFEDEKKYAFKCPNCGEVWTRVWGEKDAETSFSVTRPSEAATDKEETKFYKVLDEVLANSDQITTIDQLKEVRNRLIGEANNAFVFSSKVVASEYMAVAVTLVIEYIINHYRDLVNEEDDELSDLVNRAYTYIQKCLEVLPDDPEYLLLHDAILSLKSRTVETQLELGEGVPYIEENFENSIFRYEYLRGLYEKSRYLAVLDLVYQVRKKDDEGTEANLWELLLTFTNLQAKIDANLNLYWIVLEAETNDDKLGIEAENYLLTGYSLLDFDTALEDENESWLELAEQYAEALVYGQYQSRRQDFKEGFAILKHISDLEFDCLAKELANISLGEIYEEGKLKVKDLSKALIHYKRVGYEYGIKRLMSSGVSGTTTTVASSTSISTSSSIGTSYSYSLNNEEQEYFDECKVCFENGEISKGERRLLEKLRLKLKISETRAVELEDLAHEPQLTESEKEYLDEYRECLAEESSISTGERRLLNRLRVKLGISEERASEIEKM